jgi:hypothetical protein
MSQRRGSTFAEFVSYTEASGGCSCAAAWWGLHPSERLFHFAEDPNRVGNQTRRTIAFEPRDQLSLTLNTSALVDNIRLADLDRRFDLCARVGHVIQTPAQSKSSKKPTPATF